MSSEITRPLDNRTTHVSISWRSGEEEGTAVRRKKKSEKRDDLVPRRWTEGLKKKRRLSKVYFRPSDPLTNY